MLMMMLKSGGQQLVILTKKLRNSRLSWKRFYNFFLTFSCVAFCSDFQLTSIMSHLDGRTSVASTASVKRNPSVRLGSSCKYLEKLLKNCVKLMVFLNIKLERPDFSKMWIFFIVIRKEMFHLFMKNHRIVTVARRGGLTSTFFHS